MSASVSAVAATSFKRFAWTQTIISRFVARRTIIAAAFWALLFGVFVASKSAGYAAAYPSAVARAKLAVSFGNNIGLSALFGAPHAINTVAGFTVWNTLNVMVIVGGIWALMTATKALRGEEESGRWELLLSGQTTARRACLNALAGLASGLLVMYAVAAIAFIVIGKIHSVDFSASAGLFFALAAMSGAAIFMAVGALTAELMPTRSQAAGLAAAIFGFFFVIRAVADITTLHWLLWITPLGWIEKLQPLYGSRPIWLIPIASLILALSVLTVLIAQRDLGDSVFADRGAAKSHLRLLNSSLGMSFRLTRSKAIAWLVAIAFGATFFGLLTKSAVSAFSGSSSIQNRLQSIVHATQSTGALVFLGVVFYLLMLLIMAMAASSISGIREDESEGFLDNLLVRGVSRMRWLLSRVFLGIITIVVAGLLISSGVGLGLIHQSFGISFSLLLQSGLNAIVPALFVFGVGIMALGFLPRLASAIAYAVIAWSFLISIVSSGINLNHWISDTSILQHMALAPAANPTWNTNLIIVAVSLVFIIIGALRFNSRDLQGE